MPRRRPYLAVGWRERYSRVERTGAQVDEPANDNQQPVPEAGTADSADAKANAVQRGPIVADIPTVAPSQRLRSGPSDAGGDAAEPATGEAQPAGKTDAPPAPMPGSEAGAAAPE